MLRTALAVVCIAGTSATALAAVTCASVVAVTALTLATVWVSIPLVVRTDAAHASGARSNGTSCVTSR